MNVLITGITGFVGSHMAEYCLGRGVDVYGTVRWRSQMENLEDIKDRVHLVECDMTDSVSVNRMIAQVRPERVFHLAAQSFVPTSWHAPQDTLHTNIVSQLNLFEALRGTETRIQLAGSSEEYGLEILKVREIIGRIVRLVNAPTALDSQGLGGLKADVVTGHNARHQAAVQRVAAEVTRIGPISGSQEVVAEVNRFLAQLRAVSPSR